MYTYVYAAYVCVVMYVRLRYVKRLAALRNSETNLNKPLVWMSNNCSNILNKWYLCMYRFVFNMHIQICISTHTLCMYVFCLSWRPGQTEHWQPIDCGHIGQLIKTHIRLLQEKWLLCSSNWHKWESNKLTVGDRRVLLTVWAADAWETVCTKHKDALRKAFTSGGCG